MRSDFPSLRGAEPSTDANSFSGAEPPAGGRHRDLAHYLVPPAMLVVAIAMGIAAHLHLGLTGEMAAATGVALFCVMLMCHILLRMADEADRAAEDAAERGIRQVSSPMPVEPPIEASIVEPRVEPIAELVPTFDHVQPRQEMRAEAEAGAPGWSFRPVDLVQPDAGLPAAPVPHDATVPGSFGEFRPTFAEHNLRAIDVHAAMPLVVEPRVVDREADRIDAILKRLADQIHAGAAGRQQEVVEASELVAGQPLLPAQSDAAAAVPLEEGQEVPLEELAAANPDSALASAVDALRSTVEAMRGSPGPVVPELSPAEVTVAAVAEAIQAESADVFLSPILGLAEQSARHFEVSVKLRVDTGDERAVAAGAGLLPLLDALSVRHAAGFASMLGRRGRDGAVFSLVGGKSLESDRFVSDVAGRHAQGLADRMVLAFAQDEMRGLGPGQLAALEDLARLGFRFSLQGVADLDMDFEALQALGFEFVKLDATVFQAGLFCDGETVPASEICEHFQDVGLSVIVGDIADADTRDRLVGWGVVYGQGALFGPPRPVPVAAVGAGTMAA